jgi:hypothetical protein
MEGVVAAQSDEAAVPPDVAAITVDDVGRVVDGLSGRRAPGDGRRASFHH